ncbi:MULTISPECIES: hypothetical protein [unclassified Maridesulfovibrio]|uniref:hypothetical protein n=1 Tax=unclassified Maridesulfovibrio TaxID=2794999 RepID=UPI003B405A3A
MHTQLSLFDDTATRLGDLDAAIARAMHQAFARCGKSKDEIVDAMNAVADRGRFKLTKGNAKALTVATFEKWLSVKEKHHVPPSRAINAFCEVVKDLTPLQVQLQVHGADIMTPKDRKLRDYGAIVIKDRKTKRDKRKMEEELL